MGEQAAVAEPPEAQAPVTPETTATEQANAAAETTTTQTAQEAPPPAAAPSKSARGVKDYDYDEVLRRAKNGDIDASLQAKPGEEVTTPETPATETPPPATTETPAPATETPAVEPETPVETETEPTTSEKRIRLKGLPDGYLVDSANEIARAEGITFKEAFERVTRKADAATEQPAPADGPKLRTRAEVEADIASANTELDAAAESLDNMEAGAAKRQREAQKKAEALKLEIGQIETAETQAEQKRQADEQQTFETTVGASKAKAVKDYPEAGDPNSEFSKTMIELSNQFENDSDPEVRAMVGEPDAPEYFAKLAAKKLGVLPAHLRTKESPKPPATTPTKSSTSPAAPKVPAPVTQRAVGRPVSPAAAPASGDARTTQETNPDPYGLDKIRSSQDYEDTLSRMTGKRL